MCVFSTGSVHLFSVLVAWQLLYKGWYLTLTKIEGQVDFTLFSIIALTAHSPRSIHIESQIEILEKASLILQMEKKKI